MEKKHRIRKNRPAVAKCLPKRPGLSRGRFLRSRREEGWIFRIRCFFAMTEGFVRQRGFETLALVLWYKRLGDALLRMKYHAI